MNLSTEYVLLLSINIHNRPRTVLSDRYHYNRIAVHEYHIKLNQIIPMNKQRLSMRKMQSAHVFSDFTINIEILALESKYHGNGLTRHRMICLVPSSTNRLTHTIQHAP